MASELNKIFTVYQLHRVVQRHTNRRLETRDGSQNVGLLTVQPLRWLLAQVSLNSQSLLVHTTHK